MKFIELIRLLEQNGFRIVKEKGSIRYYRDESEGTFFSYLNNFQRQR
jgi:predicted RNA binding protein YcfA (HicA-like mRNA interferase family)